MKGFGEDEMWAQIQLRFRIKKQDKIKFQLQLCFQYKQCKVTMVREMELMDLDDLILERVMVALEGYHDVTELLKMQSLCKRLHAISKSPVLWRALIWREYGWAMQVAWDCMHL